jgi:hypothetical protein
MTAQEKLEYINLAIQDETPICRTFYLSKILVSLNKIFRITKPELYYLISENMKYLNIRRNPNGSYSTNKTTPCILCGKPVTSKRLNSKYCDEHSENGKKRERDSVVDKVQKIVKSYPDNVFTTSNLLEYALDMKMLSKKEMSFYTSKVIAYAIRRAPKNMNLNRIGRAAGGYLFERINKLEENKEKDAIKDTKPIDVEQLSEELNQHFPDNRENSNIPAINKKDIISFFMSLNNDEKTDLITTLIPVLDKNKIKSELDKLYPQFLFSDVKINEKLFNPTVGYVVVVDNTPNALHLKMPNEELLYVDKNGFTLNTQRKIIWMSLDDYLNDMKEMLEIQAK